MFRGRSIYATLLPLACAIAVRCGSSSSEPSTAATPASGPPAATASPSLAGATSQPGTTEPAAPLLAAGDLPPLPLTPFPAARPPEIIRAVYTFAAKHPEILSHVPCFCGCEQRGHRNNDNCFVSARDAHGRPTAWEPHGMG